MLDEEAYFKLRTILLDPKNPERVRYGAVQSVMNKLLNLFIRRLLDPSTDVPTMLREYGVDTVEEVNTSEVSKLRTDTNPQPEDPFYE